MENQHIRKASQGHPASGQGPGSPAARPALHMTAEDVYRRLIDSGEEIGLATVYRVLTHFEPPGS